MRHNGFSLTELLITLAIATLLLTAAVPGLGRLVANSRRTADINALVSAIHLARNEAARQSGSVRLCPSLDGSVCLDDGAAFSFGWIVRIDRAAGAGAAGGRESEVLLAYTPRIQGTVHANRTAFVFRPNFRRGTNGTITFCDRRGADEARAVIVSYTGRPRVSSQAAGGLRLRCPGGADD